MSRDAGFTLLEMLVALALLGLVLAAAAGSFGLVSAAFDRAGRQADRAAEVGLLRDLLRRQVARALPLAGPAAEGQVPASLFEGTATDLSFVIAEPPGLGGAGLIRVRFRTEPAPAGLRLLYSQGDQVRVLAEGPFELAFSYLAADGTWSGAWRSRPAPPRLVRLALSHGGHRLADTVAAPRADAERGCVLSLGEGPCRDWPEAAP